MVPLIAPTRTWITVAIPELIHATLVLKLRGFRVVALTDAFIRPNRWVLVLSLGIVQALTRLMVTLDNLFDKRTYSFRDGAATFECLPYQLSTVRYARTMALTGNGESEFDSGEAA